MWGETLQGEILIGRNVIEGEMLQGEMLQGEMCQGELLQGDPNRNLLFQMGLPLKWCIFDPRLVKPKCV